MYVWVYNVAIKVRVDVNYSNSTKQLSEDRHKRKKQNTDQL